MKASEFDPGHDPDSEQHWERYLHSAGLTRTERSKILVDSRQILRRVQQDLDKVTNSSQLIRAFAPLGDMLTTILQLHGGFREQGMNNTPGFVFVHQFERLVFALATEEDSSGLVKKIFLEVNAPNSYSQIVLPYYEQQDLGPENKLPAYLEQTFRARMQTEKDLPRNVSPVEELYEDASQAKEAFSLFLMNCRWVFQILQDALQKLQEELSNAQETHSLEERPLLPARTPSDFEHNRDMWEQSLELSPERQQAYITEWRSAFLTIQESLDRKVQNFETLILFLKDLPMLLREILDLYGNIERYGKGSRQRLQRRLPGKSAERIFVSSVCSEGENPEVLSLQVEFRKKSSHLQSQRSAMSALASNDGVTVILFQLPFYDDLSLHALMGGDRQEEFVLQVKDQAGGVFTVTPFPLSQKDSIARSLDIEFFQDAAKETLGELVKLCDVLEHRLSSQR